MSALNGITEATTGEIDFGRISPTDEVEGSCFEKSMTVLECYNYF